MNPAPVMEVLAGRTALVTGGARGLGLAIAGALAEAGAAVALGDLIDGRSAAERLSESFGHAASFAHMDVTSEESVESAFDQSEDRLGPIDILVNCAGVTSGESALTMSLEDWRRLIDVNLTGTFLTSQIFARRFSTSPQDQAKQAAIINISSMSGFAVNIPQTQTAYNTSKAAVSMFTKSAAVEWLPLGIRVNAIAPGYFASDMTRDFVANHPEMAKEWISRIPAGRMGEPHELGPLAVYLASDAASYVVGQSFLIDGGYTLP